MKPSVYNSLSRLHIHLQVGVSGGDICNFGSYPYKRVWRKIGSVAGPIWKVFLLLHSYFLIKRSRLIIERISTCVDCNEKHDDDDTACRIPSSRSNKPHTIAFNSDGSLKYVELKIMNLRPPGEAHPTSNKWEEIGVWNSEKGKKINLLIPC